MHRIRTETHSPCTRVTWRERAFVFAGIAFAGGVTGVGRPLGAGEEILAPVWLGALAWTVLASLAHVLWRGFRHGDWSGVTGGARDRGRFESTTGELAWNEGGRFESAGSSWLGGDTDREIFDPTYSFLQANIYHYRHDD